MAGTTVEIPDLDLWAFLFERPSKSFPDDQVIYRCPITDRHYTYADVKQTATRFGTGLRSRWAWKKGDVLAIFSPNCIDTPAVTWGCHWAGGTVSPANPAYTADELATHLKDCGARVLVTQCSGLPIALEAVKAVRLSVKDIILIGDQEDTAGKCSHFKSVLNGAVGKRTPLDPKNDLAFLVYSSGTTGHPKGVMLSHSNVISNLVMLSTIEGKNLRWKEDKILSVLPYYHIYGLSCLVHQPMQIGVETIVMPSFDLKMFCSIVQNHKVTYSYIAPPIAVHLAKNPLVESYNLKSLRMVTSGAAPLTKELILEVYERLGLRVKQAYGLSETSPVTHMQEWDDSWKSVIGSVGKALPNQELKFIAMDGKTPVPAGKEGEIWIKGPNVFKGYHKNQKASAEALTTDGFFKTGDVAYEDANGNLFITDRVKELIKYKGSQVAPAELEGIILSHPKVEDVAVIGFYVQEIATEVPMAFIVAKQGVTQDEQAAKELIEWVASKTAATKRLRGGIVWTDQIPKSASGKILRRILKEMTTGPDAKKAMAAMKYKELARL